MWPLVLLGTALAGVAYVVTRPPEPDAPATPQGKGGFLVTWNRTGTEHWYASLAAVKAEAQRIEDGGLVTSVSGKFYGFMGRDGLLSKR
jgi:hypothetical protein